MRFFVILTLVVGCTSASNESDSEFGDSDTQLEEGVCEWVVVRPERANCTSTVGAVGDPRPLVITYDALGLETSIRSGNNDVDTTEYDARGRLALIDDRDGFQVTDYDWLGCYEYVTETMRDGDLFEDSEVVLRDNGEIDSRVSRRYFGGLVTEEGSYTSTWEGERLLSSILLVDGVFGRSWSYTYGTDGFGNFQSVERRDSDNQVDEQSTTWSDSQGRIVRFAELADDGEPTFIVTTEYDGTGVDATSTVQVDRGGDGSVDSSTVTTFLPDGRIDQVETLVGGSSSVDVYGWECSDG